MIDKLGFFKSRNIKIFIVAIFAILSLIAGIINITQSEKLEYLPILAMVINVGFSAGIIYFLIRSNRNLSITLMFGLLASFFGFESPDMFANTRYIVGDFKAGKKALFTAWSNILFVLIAVAFIVLTVIVILRRFKINQNILLTISFFTIIALTLIIVAFMFIKSIDYSHTSIGKMSFAQICTYESYFALAWTVFVVDFN